MGVMGEGRSMKILHVVLTVAAFGTTGKGMARAPGQLCLCGARLIRPHLAARRWSR
jgi:hypothetical protein